MDAEQIFDPVDKPRKKIGHIRLKPLPLLRYALPDAVDDGLADVPVGLYVGQKAADDRLHQTRHSRDDVPGVGHEPGRQRDDDLDAHADDLRQHRVKRLDKICDDARDGIDQLRDRRDKPAGKCQHQLHCSLDQQRDRLGGRDLAHDAEQRGHRRCDDARQLLRDAEQQRADQLHGRAGQVRQRGQ